MPPLTLRPREISFHVRHCRTRLPFRFGVHTLTAAPLCLARLVAETPGGRSVAGFSSDLLVPRWFEKTPNQTIEDDWRRLIASAREAGAAALLQATHNTVFDHWLTLYQARVPGAPESERLLRGQGASLVERALIDAACRAAGVPFFEALKSDLLGFRPGRLDPGLADWSLAASLPARAPSHIHLRHTVGLVDAIRRADVPDDRRINDALPESLEEDIEHDALTHFKLKLAGDSDADVDRLLRIMEVIVQRAPNPRVTLDGNEQFQSMHDLARTLECVGRHELGRRLLADLLVIEQPLSRARTFDADANAGIDAVSAHAPCIIDEADAEVDALPRAAALGYRGVSVKNCKGVFRALLNFGRCQRSQGRLLQTAEDLTNLPIVALQQDLATVSAIGLTHAERNGHHYFHGLRHLPRSAQTAALCAHPDLYNDAPTGPRLRIENGGLSTASIHRAQGYAFHVAHDLREWTPLEQWSPNNPRSAEP